MRETSDYALSRQYRFMMEILTQKKRLLLVHRMKNPLNQRHFSGAGFGAGLE
jgi:hypothetical protein